MMQDFDECGGTNGNCTSGACSNVIGANVSTPICLPVAINCSLALGSGSRSCNVTLTDNAAGHNITFLLTGPLAPTLALNMSSVSFGPPSDPKRFTCASAAIIGGNAVQCIPPAGVFGTNLAITLTVCASAVSKCWELAFRNAGVFHHPNPVISSNTIRFSGGSNSAGITAPSNVGGDTVVFSGTNFGVTTFRTSPFYKVQYRSGAVVKQCIIDANTTTAQISCTTQPGKHSKLCEKRNWCC